MEARASANDQRLGQYLYNVMRQGYKPGTGFTSAEEAHRRECEYIADKLWNIESDELIKLIESYEKKIEKRG